MEEEALGVQREYHRYLIGKYGQAECPLVVAKDKTSIRYTFDHSHIPVPEKLEEYLAAGGKLAVKWAKNLRLWGITTGCTSLLYLQAVKMRWISGEMNEIQMFKSFLSFLVQHPKKPEQVDTTGYPKKFKHFWSKQVESSELGKYFFTELLVEPFYAAPFCNVEALFEYAKKTLKVMDTDPSQVSSLFTVPISSADFDLVAYHKIEFPFDFLAILEEAAGDRFPLIHCFEDGKQLGIKLNPQTCFALAVLGPVNSLENTEHLKRFRFLWGERTELRKFAAEGAIRCCVVFEEAAGDRLQLGKLILEHLFSVHCISEDDSTLNVPYESFKSVYHFDSLQSLIGVYEDFGRVLRSIKGLPLSIVETVPLGSSLCALSVQVPQEADNSGRIISGLVTPVQPMMLIFEKSGKWPEDLQAIKHLKTALLLALSNTQALTPSPKKALTTSMSHEGFMDVLFKGYVFRLHVFCEKEMLVMKRDGLDLTGYWNEWVARPMHYRLMSQLLPRFPLYAPACRLFKQWVRKHRLSVYLDEMTCELLVASVFLESAGSSFSICNLAVVLYKVFKILKDMETVPVVVDIDGLLDREAVYNEFYRLKNGSLVFVTSPKIQPEHAFSKPISKPVGKYLSRVSLACMRYLEEFFHARIPTLTEIFTPLPNSNSNLTKLTWADTNSDRSAMMQLIREESIGSAPFMRLMPGFDARKHIIDGILERYTQAQVYPDDEFILVGDVPVIADLLNQFPGAFY